MRTDELIPLYFESMSEVREVFEDLERLSRSHFKGLRDFYSENRGLMNLHSCLRDLIRKDQES